MWDLSSLTRDGTCIPCSERMDKISSWSPAIVFARFNFAARDLCRISFTSELLPLPEQRRILYSKIREYRKTKPIFTIDFQHDGEFVGGCIAGGRSYLHINANGDIEPCAFIHYADSNIKEHTLLEAYKRPLFMAYRAGQPFNENMLKPCPMLENPDALLDMVKRSGAHSTDMQSPEDIEDLYSKCKPYADRWTPTADELWSASHGCAGCGTAKR